MNVFALTAVLSYLLGSIPFGYILVRWFRGEDVRRTGSGNIGATNVSRTSPFLGVITLSLDALKGTAAVLLTRALFPNNVSLLYWAALFAVLGHAFPLWLKFLGGKGVATALGSFSILAPKAVLVAVTVFVVLVVAFRYVSLASVVAVVLLPIAVFILGPRHETTETIIPMVTTSLLIVAKHSANIRRLRAGTENRLTWWRE